MLNGENALAENGTVAKSSNLQADAADAVKAKNVDFLNMKSILVATEHNKILICFSF